MPSTALYRRLMGRSLRMGLVDYWKLDEPSGNAISFFGKNNLTAMGAPGEGVGPGGWLAKCRTFNGTTQYFDGGQPVDLQSNSHDHSIACWVNTNNANTEQWYAGIEDPAENRSFVLRNGAFGSGVVDFGIATSPLLISASNWFFVVGIHNHKANLNAVSINGMNWGNLSGGGFGNYVNGPFLVGAELGTTHFLNGQLAGLGWWKRCLLPSEVLALYNNGIPPPI